MNMHDTQARQTAATLNRKQRFRAWRIAHQDEGSRMLIWIAKTAIVFLVLIFLGYYASRVWSAANGDPRIEGTMIATVIWISALAFLLHRAFGMLSVSSRRLTRVASDAPMGRAQLQAAITGDLHREARHAALHIVVGWQLGFIITSSDIRNASCLYSWSFNATEVSGADARFASIALHLAGLLEGEPITLVQSRDSNHALSLATEIVAAGERPTVFDGDLDVGALSAAAASRARAIAAEHAGLVSQIASIHARTHVLDERLIAELLTPFLAHSTITR